MQTTDHQYFIESIIESFTDARIAATGTNTGFNIPSNELSAMKKMFDPDVAVPTSNTSNTESTMNTNTTTKTCTKCHVEKQLTDFVIATKTKTGRSGCCKQCHRIYTRKDSNPIVYGLKNDVTNSIFYIGCTTILPSARYAVHLKSTGCTGSRQLQALKAAGVPCSMITLQTLPKGTSKEVLQSTERQFIQFFRAQIVNTTRAM